MALIVCDLLCSVNMMFVFLVNMYVIVFSKPVAGYLYVVVPVNVAPVNPGSIPAATIVNTSGAAPGAWTSVGGGIAPNLLAQVGISRYYL